MSKGESVQNTAKKFGTSIRAIYRLKARPEFIDRLTSLQTRIDDKLVEEGAKQVSEGVFLKEAARKELERAALHAARTITTLLSRRKKLDRDGLQEMRLRVDAAKDVLDRIGLKPKEVVETIERNYKPEEITSAMSTMKELAAIGRNEFVFGGKAGRMQVISSAKVELPEHPITPGDGVAEGIITPIAD